MITCSYCGLEQQKPPGWCYEKSFGYCTGCGHIMEEEIKKESKPDQADYLEKQLQKCLQAPYPTHCKVVLNCRITIESNYDKDDILAEKELRSAWLPEIKVKHKVDVKILDANYPDLEDDIKDEVYAHFLITESIHPEVKSQIESTENMWTEFTEELNDYLLANKLDTLEKPITVEDVVIGDYKNYWPFSMELYDRFEVEGVKFNSVAQYICAEAAVFFEDSEALKMILKTENRESQIKIAQEIIGFDPDKWKEKLYEVAYRGNFEKFSQNKKIQKELLNTGNAKIVDKCQFRIWDIGRATKDPACDNWLGEILMEVREELLKEYGIHN